MDGGCVESDGTISQASDECRTPSDLRLVLRCVKEDNTTEHSSESLELSAKIIEDSIMPSLSAQSFSSEGHLDVVLEAQKIEYVKTNNKEPHAVTSTHTLAVPIVCDGAGRRIVVATGHLACRNDDEVGLVLCNTSLRPAS